MSEEVITIGLRTIGVTAPRGRQVSDKRHFAPLPNRVLVDARLHGLHLRFYGVVAAHDRFGQNGLGCTLSLQRYAEILKSHKQSIARVRRQMIEWGYIQEGPHPRHSQMSMLSVVYDPDADKTALSAKTVNPQADGLPTSTVSSQVHNGAKTVSPQAYQKKLSFKEKEETRLKTKEENSAEAASLGSDDLRGQEEERGIAVGGTLAIFERRLAEMKRKPNPDNVPLLKQYEARLEQIAAEFDGHTGDPAGGRALRLVEEVSLILEMHHQ